MAVLDAKKTYGNLLSKGFKSGKGDHKFLEFYCKGKYILQTKISHGEKELESFHVGMMSRQCKLDKKRFIDLANCPLSGEEYLEILRTNGVITENDLKSAQSVNESNTSDKKRKKK
jgi:hypothetical protein